MRHVRVYCNRKALVDKAPTLSDILSVWAEQFCVRELQTVVAFKPMQGV